MLFQGGRIPVGLSEEVASEAYTASAGCAPDGGVTHAGPGAGRKQGAGATKANGTGADGGKRAGLGEVTDPRLKAQEHQGREGSRWLGHRGAEPPP